MTPNLLARIAPIAGLVAGAVALAIVLSGGGDGYRVTARFGNASQLVEGNEVVVAGMPAGSVEEISLGPSGEALVELEIDEQFAPLERGTEATIRSYSLSGIANRQVQLTLPEGSAGGEHEEIADGGAISQEHTTSEVDLDHVFNTLDDRTIANLKKVINGFEASFGGVGREANRGFRYLNPFLFSSRRFFAELTRDERTFERVVVDTSRLSGALAQRAPEIRKLVGNLDLMMGALGRRKTELARALSELPDFLRLFDSTAVRLRATLDDLDPLVGASRPVARKLRPFFDELRAATARLEPEIADLDAVVRRGGADNDLVELLRLQGPLAESGVGSGSPECGSDPATDFASAADDDFAQGALGEARCALANSLPVLAFFRPYTPELVGWFDDFGHSGTVDANGGIGRIFGTFNTFGASLPGLPDIGGGPQTPHEQLAQLDVNNLERCPGANERDPGDGSIPFTDDGLLDCDPTEVPVGP